jgi:hypothetical protein
MDSLLRVCGRDDHSEEGPNRQMVDPYEQERVNQVPQPLSPTYRTRVRKLSATYRNRHVHHEPNSDTSPAKFV